MVKYENGVLLIETITKSEKCEEVESLRHLLTMTDFSPEWIKITGKDNKEDFVLQFAEEHSKKGYIHVSAHGDINGFYIHGERETPVTIDDFIEYENKLKGSMKGRFLTISACSSLSKEFLNNLFKLLQFEAVICPTNEVMFDESAIFFINFYFNLTRRRNNRNARPEVKLVDFIDTFQKTKIGYLLQGGSGGMRLLYNIGNGKKLTTIF